MDFLPIFPYHVIHCWLSRQDRSLMCKGSIGAFEEHKGQIGEHLIPTCLFCGDVEPDSRVQSKKYPVVIILLRGLECQVSHLRMPRTQF
jgi:hypothetical protein